MPIIVVILLSLNVLLATELNCYQIGQEKAKTLKSLNYVLAKEACYIAASHTFFSPTQEKNSSCREDFYRGCLEKVSQYADEKRD